MCPNPTTATYASQSAKSSATPTASAVLLTAASPADGWGIQIVFVVSRHGWGRIRRQRDI
jgi:hypothetical protein